MRMLCDMDARDYDPKGTVVVRNSSRCIAICGGKVAMIHSLKYDYYKFPGGGIEAGESSEQALIRETLEEAGLTIIPESIREYGCIHRARKSVTPDSDYFVQDNFYYLCQVEDAVRSQSLDDYEAEERFTLEWVEPEKARRVNESGGREPREKQMAEREAKVLALLMEEGYFR